MGYGFNDGGDHFSADGDPKISTPAPIKTCDYCGKRGEMPTFRGGDTCCTSCLVTFATGNTETRRREHELKSRIAALEAENKRLHKLVNDYSEAYIDIQRKIKNDPMYAALRGEG